MTVIDAQGLVRRYRTGGQTLYALAGIDFALEAGEFVSIMGPSGSGKTTLLNTLGLLDAPTEGTVLLEGQDVTGLGDSKRTALRKRTVGFVFQHFYLLPTLTAVENVEVPLLLDSDPEVTNRARTLLERLSLGDRLDHKPDELSGGQKQRVAIARSLINSPKIVLADEPTGNLDSETGRQILNEFRRIADEDDVAIVAVTHDDLVNEYVDRTVHLVDGTIGRERKNGGRFFPAALMARRNLTRTKMRSLLASLGIVIGVVAIASLGMFGVALQYSFTQNLGNVGNELTVYPNSGENITELTERDIRTIRREASPTATVSPVKTRVETVSYNREDAASETIYGVENPAALYEAQEGRVSPFRTGALIGSDVAEEHDLHPGSQITVNGTSVRIRAVLEEGDAFSSANPDNRIIMPVGSFSDSVS